MPGRAGPIAALCHGPLVLGAVVLKGRERSAYPACALDVEIGGSTWVDSEVHVDQNLVTGRAWPDHPAWMRAFLKLLRAAALATSSIVCHQSWWRSPHSPSPYRPLAPGLSSISDRPRPCEGAPARRGQNALGADSSPRTVERDRRASGAACRHRLRLEHRVRPCTNRVGWIEPPGRVRPCCWWCSPTGAGAPPVRVLS
ncbi:DJ-1/PfpI family protein [Microbispora sp. H10885]|uniref:DJ-1/PfpI family protein n=1 Tax=Microbispora sp. H10885 TaxID=2729110 RepID=UPI0016008941